jgi:hypothetical protein
VQKQASTEGGLEYLAHNTLRELLCLGEEPLRSRPDLVWEGLKPRVRVVGSMRPHELALLTKTRLEGSSYRLKHTIGLSLA